MKRLLTLLILVAACPLCAWGQDRTLVLIDAPPTVTLGTKTTGLFEDACTETIESVSVVNGQLEIVKRSTCTPTAIPAIACIPGPCDFTKRRVFKEVYGARDGKVALLYTVEGKIVPAQAERVEWPSHPDGGFTTLKRSDGCLWEDVMQGKCIPKEAKRHAKPRP